MSCRSGCFCARKSSAVHSSKTSSCSKPISTLRKESSTKPSSPPLHYRGVGSGYSKPSVPQSKIVSRSKPAIKTTKVALSKPRSVIVPGRSGGSSSTKPSAVQSKASSGSKPSGKTKTSSAVSSCCGSAICNTKPLSYTPIERPKEPSTNLSSIPSASSSTNHCIASQNTSRSPPSTKPKNLTKSSVVVKITVRTPQTTIEQETAFDIDS